MRKYQFLKSFMLLLLALAFSELSFTSPSYAQSGSDYAGGVAIARITTSQGNINFAVTPVPVHTCTYFSVTFTFDATTPNGKNMYALLLEAKALNKPIDVWFTDSPVGGINETNGCNNGTLAVASDIGVSQ